MGLHYRLEIIVKLSDFEGSRRPINMPESTSIMQYQVYTNDSQYQISGVSYFWSNKAYVTFYDADDDIIARLSNVVHIIRTGKKPRE